MASVYIPVQNSEEEVRVVLDQLPRDASDILDILKAEQAPLDLWLIIAREYFKQGKVEQFKQILEEGSSPEIDEYYGDVRYERIAILNALGAYHSYLGKIETKQREKEEQFILATQYYNKASRIDMHEPSTWVGKGQLLLAKGDLEQAFSAFKIVLDGDRTNVPALLGQGCVEFNRGRYSQALDLYKRALRVYPNCPGAVRLGIGLCRYKMGQFDKALMAFQRVVQLDPENVEALVAMAVMDLHTSQGPGVRRGMEYMQRAFEIYPYCAMSLNYLANHFFYTGQHFLVEQLTETALAVTNHGPTKAHSFYNLARSYHSKGDYEKAGLYYMASVKESSLGQVQLKLGDYRSSLSNFEKVLEVHPENSETLKVIGHIHAQLGQTEKALDFLRKATKVDPRDAQAFQDLGELLISSDTGAALDALKNARGILSKSNEQPSVELLNDIAVLHFDRGELELAERSFREALGDGIWKTLIDSRPGSYAISSTASVHWYKDKQLFHQLEKDGFLVELPWRKVSILFNFARLLEELHKTQDAVMLYRLIIYKYSEYADAYLRLAAIAKAQNKIHSSMEMVSDALKVNEKCPTALAMLGSLELKKDDWVKAKETFRAASEATDGKDSYATLSLGNWNYFAALRNEKRAPKLEATHLEKAKELYSKVLAQHHANLYAANGAGLVFAEKGQFDVAKEIFTQVHEAASGSISVQMPDVWINLGHVYFALGNYSLAVKLYQNCLRNFFYNTDAQVLLYLARTHYEAEQWQDCKKTLLKAIHLTPSNYSLRFNAGVSMQKFSASTLQKEKRTADEVRRTVSELTNAVRVFSQLSAASNLRIHGFDEKKIETHVGYCKHLLEAAKVHCEAAEREEHQNRQRQELARQVTVAEDARRKAEEQRKLQLERRKQEDELKRVMQQEQHFERIKEQWKSNPSGSKRKDRLHADDEDVSHDKRRRKGGKRRKKDKSSKSRYEILEEEADMIDDHEEGEYDETNPSYQENLQHEERENVQDAEGNNSPELFVAAGLEDSDADEETAAPSASATRRRRAWSESDEEEGQVKSSPVREKSTENQVEREEGERTNDED
uniref:Uncharacterized protein n=1 Tax=Kalanchoe fedtschenkoi TaxID=63787 RepID=A0A7N0ZW54_KALFE